MTQATGLSQPLTLANLNMEVSSNSKDKKAASEDLVSFFFDVMDAIEYAVDAFEDSVLSQVSDPEARQYCASVLRTH